MQIRPEKTLVELIDEAVEQANPQRHRNHLGASAIGRVCSRELWYNFRWFTLPSFPGRILRLFDTGHLYEPRFVELLELIGWRVEPYEVLDDGTQQQWRTGAFGDHFGGSCDGFAWDPDFNKQHIVEFKTHNEKSFKKLQKEGVEKSKPEHYAQMQVYMYLFGVDRALYMAVNKNTDELYTEKFTLSKRVAKRLLAKAQLILEAQEPPPRLSDNPTYYACNWCNHRSACHFGAAPDLSCRSCLHCVPDLDTGDWLCVVHETDDKKLSEEDIHKACDSYSPIN